MAGLPDKKQELEEAYNTGELFRCVDDVRKAKSPVTYWGNWIVKNTIILLSGSGGISKTTFLYALITGLMDTGEFLGVAGKRDLKVLYLDIESDASLIKSRMLLLGNLATDHPNFYYCDHPGATFRELEPLIDRFIKDVWCPDLIVIDPQSLAFPAFDENSNAEATKQMGYIRDTMRRWQTTIILVSHSAKIDTFGVGNNRGASARPNLADMAWSFHSLGKEYSENLFIFNIPKNRWIHDEFFQCIEKQDGTFVRAELPENFVFKPDSIDGLTTYQIQLKIEKLLLQAGQVTVSDIMEAVDFSNASPETIRRTIYRALTPLLQTGKATKLARGIYARVN